ncbi:MAG: MazG nucleotide pyrophosphohydrolase domain-containing protein, partial [Gemmatimonadaceae bacterium]
REVREQLVATPVVRSPQGAPQLDAAHEAVEAELGDLLFAVVNLCRNAGVHASLALDTANDKFARRFTAIERLAAERGIDVPTAGLAALDELWDEIKREERAGRTA